MNDFYKPSLTGYFHSEKRVSRKQLEKQLKKAKLKRMRNEYRNYVNNRNKETSNTIFATGCRMI
ncbi:hypothetical protein Scipio_00007 [Acinetobacter phage Scipio]|nr:hypothetical protein Scipio_00007 [Acinetobacter phage Scipio]